IDALLPTGKGILVMVPEISLTPQTLSLFYSRYGEKVAVFHSALSQGERLDEWKRVHEGKAQIVVGTRSAVFAPFPHLGLIIMDEEQEHTYQSEQSPRYHARDIARFRCAQEKALLVLSSATPSFESFAAAQSGRYAYFELQNRYGKAALPSVSIVDMCQERRSGNLSQISKVLFQSLAENLEQGRQSILLLNRRGYHTFAECMDCGAVVTCPNCSISLTYHKANHRLMCHYCGYSVPFTKTCSVCGQDAVGYSGSGTQKLEEELQSLLPTASILRMDTDTTMQKYAYDENWRAFQEGKYDIMIGTQMVAKGLDFENVTLVGVLNADKELYNDDYKSMERTFDLITQVVGRAGRGKYPGKAFIQTKNAQNEVLRLAARQDYKAFFRTEIAIRKAMAYPPYCTLLSVSFQGKKETQVKRSAASFMDLLKAEAPLHYPDVKLIALGPMEERILKMGGKYRYRLLIKCRNSKRFREMLSALLMQFSAKRENSGVQAIVSVEN
ncbi:MAG TPA: primosomal protein N', partial [Clostridiales bacterium]|nr:primosomal protein N' [Clostridiales bacterium]